jgi:hypothetical protein
VKKCSLFVCFVALCSVTLLGQAGRPLRVVHNVDKSAVNVAPQETPQALSVIYNNLSTKNDAYSTTEGWVLAGPTSVGGQEFIGIPFTPKSNAHVSEVRSALQYGGFGANQVNLSIYGDSSGAPGTLLGGPVTVTNLPAFGTCCTLAIADFAPIAVTAGTKYWIVANTPLSGTGSDFYGGWEWVAKASVLWADDFDSNGWSLTPSDGLPAGEVLGAIP